jgi:hypothetical protein
MKRKRPTRLHPETREKRYKEAQENFVNHFNNLVSFMRLIVSQIERERNVNP